MDALAAVGAERARQLRLKAEGRFQNTPSDDELNDWQRLGIDFGRGR